VSTTEELLERKSSGSGLETEITATGIHRADHVTPLYPQNLALTSVTSEGRSVGVVRLRTKATELLLCLTVDTCYNVPEYVRIVQNVGFTEYLGILTNTVL
jgi:hypothetical protein